MSVPTRVEKSFTHCPDLTGPCILTIGTFDGLHLGHRAVLQSMFEKSERQLPTVVVTFSNHPSEVVRPDKVTPLLISSAHKVHLLQEAGVDLVFLLPFTKSLSQLSAAEFMQQITGCIPVSHLVLGHDARVGFERQGDVEVLRSLGNQLGFTVSQLTPLKMRGITVSSTRIRKHLVAAELDEAAVLLGRQPSVFGIAQPGQGVGRTIGFPTLNLDITGLCTPPHGVYAVRVCGAGKTWQGVANLGLAPTVRADSRVVLESHLFGYNGGLEQSEVTVYLRAFLRSELKFASLAHLREQIAKDIILAKEYS